MPYSNDSFTLKATLDEIARPFCVGYHIYRDIVDAAVGEVLACGREPTNPRDVKEKYSIVMGHVQ